MNQPPSREPDREQLPALSTNSLLAAKAKSQAILATPAPSMSYATKCAKILVGYFPNARPADPAVYAEGIVHALAGYPRAIVEECCDVRLGLARRLDFPPTPKQVQDFCDGRMAYHKVVAMYELPKPKAPEPQFSEEHKAGMIEKFNKLIAFLRGRPT